MGDDVLVVVEGIGYASEVGGVGYADHEAVFAEGEVCLQAGVGEGAVGEHIGHAIVAVGVCVQYFVAYVRAPGTAGELYVLVEGVADVQLFDGLCDTVVGVGKLLCAGSKAQVGHQVYLFCFVLQLDGGHAQSCLVVAAGEAGVVIDLFVKIVPVVYIG